MEEKIENQQNSQEPSTKSEIKEFLTSFITMLVVILLLRKFVITPVTVQGASMNYTLEDGQVVFVSPLAKIDRSDVVIFDAPDNPDRMYVKRVIGMPGDSIEFKDDKLYLNGEFVEESYLDEGKAEFTSEYGDLPEPIQPNFTGDFTLEEVTGQTTVPEGKAFVLGDNRANSHDGRSYGFVDIDELTQVVFRLWPLNKIGTID